MTSALLSLALALLPVVGRQPDDDPRAVVRQAVLAVEGDSAPSLRARWSARVERDAADRAATLGLATVARLTYDYDTAERFYRQLFATDSVQADRYAAYARLGFAEGLEARSFGAAALEQFTRARQVARALRDRTAEGEALIYLTFSRGRLQGIPVAEATLDSAAALIPAPEFAARARIAERRAILYSLRGRTDAEAEAAQAIALARRSGELGALADAFRTLGKVLQYAGQVDSALVVLRAAEDLYVRAHNRSALATSLIWQAQVLGATARYGEWREVMRRALREGEATKNPAAIADAHRALGTLGIMLGDFASAAEHLEKSTAISRETGDSSSVRVTQKIMLDVLIAGRALERSKRLAHELLATAVEPRAEFELRAALVAIAISERDWAGAERAIADARAVLSRLPGRRYAHWVLHDDARLALARGDLAAAERALLASIEQAGGDAGDMMRADAHLRLADVYARRGELERAERAMTSSLDELDVWRGRSTDAEVRRFAFQATALQHEAAAEKGEQGARAARVIAALARGGRRGAAFALAERRRARELRDRFLRADALRGAPHVAADTGHGPGGAPVSAAEIAGALPDDRTALLEYVGGTSGAPTTVFVVRRSGVTSVALDVDSLTERARRFVSLLEAGRDASGMARALGAALLDPIADALDDGVTRLVIVPDGALHAIPWDALRLRDGFVVEKLAVGIAPSAAVAAELWRRRAVRAAPVRLLAFGDPAFPAERDAGAAAEAYRSAFESTGGLPRLRASGGEAKLVARYAPRSAVLVREAASASFLKRAALDSFQVIHFATHALVDEQSVARTALALAPGDGESGFVGPGDLAALELDADLVVLSACRTAGGVVLSGEGVQGLTAPFLEAGARSVVATQWQIADQTTTRIVERFYDALARGLPLSEALREAKLDAMRRGRPPREWAAFTVVGDPFVTIPLRHPAGRPWWAAGAVALLVLVAASAGVRRARRRLGS
jgi:CHAT domain-containing protein/tetratricopeptide (TPR) repeat protein